MSEDARISEWGSEVDIEVLGEGWQGEALVSFRRGVHLERPGEEAETEDVSVGWFPAPEPWLAQVLPH